MPSRALSLIASLLVFLVPAVGAQPADPGEAGPSTNHDCTNNLDGIDLLCWHEDCTPRFCVVMLCVVHLNHNGHAHERLFGCTPP